MTAARFTMPLRVRYVECDMQDRVFNGHYLTWVDMAHTDAMEELTGGYRALVDGGIDLVVAAAALQFRSPARFDDRLTVDTTIHPPGNTSLRSDFAIFRDAELLAECAHEDVVARLAAGPAAATLTGRIRCRCPGIGSVPAMPAPCASADRCAIIGEVTRRPQ